MSEPQSVIQASGKVATSVAASLGAQPVLLVVVLLNMTMIGAATYYLVHQEAYRHTERVQLLERCMRPAPLPSGSGEMIGPRLDGTAGGPVADRS